MGMVLWQSASVAFFAYLILVAILRPTPPRARGRVVWSASVGGLLVAISSAVGRPAFLSQWIWPALVLLIAYWSSGLLFVAPRPSQEATLRWLDDRLAVRAAARKIPRVLVEGLEAAYAGVYLLVPLALLLHLDLSRAPDADRFWAVILITDFVCFGVLPWVQTRPPRALEPGAPWESSIRRFNLRLLGATSIQVNTFPSGHAAEALAAFLLVCAAVPPVVAGAMFLAAVAVSAGAVLGRYHYLADALAGWAVALVVFLVVS
jgi:membrane-associated phospholipid phosphatase